MPSAIIEQTYVPVDAQFEDDVSDVDETYRQVAKVTYCTSLLIEGLGYPETATEEALELRKAFKNAIRIGNLSPPEGSDYATVLEEALRAGQAVLNYENREAIKEDFSQIDDETLREVRASIGYLAPHFGLDVDLPQPDGDTGGER